MSATHNNLITLNIVLDPAPIAATNFGLTALLADNVFGDSDTYRTYGSYAAMQADSDLSEAIIEAGRVAFSQIRKPSSFLVGEVNHTGTDLGAMTLTFNDSPLTITRSTGSWIADDVKVGDTVTPAGTVSNNATYTVTAVTSATVLTVTPAPTDEVAVAASAVTWVQQYDNALATIIEDGAQFFGVTLDSRTAADQLLVSADVEPLQKVCVLQTADADCLTASWPTGLADVEDRENSAVIYHNDSNEWADVAWLTGRIAHDFDNTSPTAEGALREVDAADVTDTQRDHCVDNNINIPLEMGPESAWVYPGVNAAGRPFDFIWSIYWFVDRVNADLGVLKATYAAQGKKIPMDAEGQFLLESTIQKKLDRAIELGHFKEDQYVFKFPAPIPGDELTARDLTATVYITNETGASKFTITFNFSQADVVPVPAEEA